MSFSPIEETDEELVARAKRELPYTTSAFDALVRRYEPRVYAMARRYLGSDADAEDVSQRVFVRVFRSLKRFEGRAAFSSWLWRITQNQCASRFDQRKRTLHRRERYKNVGRPEGAHDPRESLAEELSEDGRVKAALEKLREQDRAVLLMRFTSDLSIEEIASALEIKESAAKMRLKRARERFEKAFLAATKSASDSRERQKSDPSSKGEV